jgi:predicted ester cyclase
MATDPARLQQNEQVVENFFQAINARRLEDLPKYMAADVVDHNKIIYGEADEPGAAFEGLRQQLVAFNPLHFQVEEFIAEGDLVVARTTMSVVQSGYHPRMPEPTHRSAVVEGIYLFTIKNGKISEIRAVVDRLGLFLQLRWNWPKVD